MAMNNAHSEQPPPSVDQIIGANVHALMWARHETQTTLAKDWGITAGALSLKIRGKRPWSADDVRRVANRYGIDPGILFDRNMRMPDYEFASSRGTAKVVSLFDYQHHPRSKYPPH